MSTTASASSMSSRFGDENPFKVQVNFDIPLFEGNIDVYALVLGTHINPSPYRVSILLLDAYAL